MEYQFLTRAVYFSALTLSYKLYTQIHTCLFRSTDLANNTSDIWNQKFFEHPYVHSDHDTV